MEIANPKCQYDNPGMRLNNQLAEYGKGRNIVGVCAQLQIGLNSALTRDVGYFRTASFPFPLSSLFLQ